MNKAIELGDLTRLLGARYGLAFVRDEHLVRHRKILDEAFSNLPLAGHLNLVRPNRLQIIGDHEAAYIGRLSADARSRFLRELGEMGSIAVLFADGTRPLTDEYRETLRASDPTRRDELPAMMRAAVSSHELSAVLRYHLQQQLAPSRIRHGVFMEILGAGVLIEGDPSVGKSEVALELISRGHRLIADDAPEFTRIAPDIVRGECPALLQDLLEVRGLGVLNIRAMYGDAAIKKGKYLRLIMRLRAARIDEVAPPETRLDGSGGEVDVLGLKVPYVSLPIAPGRNIAVLIEAAVRNHLLRMQGYNAASDLRSRHNRLLLGNPDPETGHE